MKYLRLIPLLLLGLLFSVAASQADAPPVSDDPSEVIRHPNPSAPLAQRWAWGIEQGTSRRGGFWVGYTIRQMMPEGSAMYMGHGISIHSNGRPRWKGNTLADVLAGRTTQQTDDEDVQEAAQRALERKERKEKTEEKLVWKEVAILLHFPANGKAFDEVMVGNVEANFDLDREPLFWLSGASDAESLDLVQARYNEAQPIKLKKNLIAAYGMHRMPDRVVPWLGNLLNSREDDDLREATTLWLGTQHDERALKILEEAARRDRSGEVREAAVFGISQAHLPRAADVLIDLARTADDSEVRENAVFWLGQQGTQKAAEALESFVNSGDTEIQKKAVFAISQLDTQDSVERLISIAKTHPRKETRKEAIFWLSQKASERAAEMLGTFARDDEDTDVQKQAVFALSQLHDGAGITDLIEISKTHPNAEVRKSAIFWLGQSGDPRALDVLEALVMGR